MNRRILLVAVTLVLSFGLRMWLNAVPVTAKVPDRESLAGFPKEVGSWNMVREDKLDVATSSILKADDYVMRSYRKEDGKPVNFFVAYYKAQGAGESMHSPKNCLPGAGWEASAVGEVDLWPDRPAGSTMINRYVVENNGEKAIVLYWYQANGRVIASEYWGKIYLILDTIRTGRRDGAIVRFVVPVRKGSDGNAELQTGLDLARTTAPLLPKYLPN